MGLPLLPAAMAGGDALPARTAARFAPFCALLQEVYAAVGTMPLADMMELLLERIGYDEYLRNDRRENYEARAQIVEEFVGYAREFEADLADGGQDALRAFLETVALFTTTDELDAITQAQEVKDMTDILRQSTTCLDGIRKVVVDLLV